ncbi:MAG: ATP-binding protein [Deltaproteobacteria bacterium]|nr:ATP-binding protein [Deltaproteobacteria bacterium]
MDPTDPTQVPSLADIVDPKTLDEVCRALHDLFDLPVRVFATDGKLLVETTHTPPLCHAFNKIEKGRSACTATREGIKRARPRVNETVEVVCPMGLRYEISPVMFQGSSLGKVVLGPYLPAGLDEIPAEALAVAPELDPAAFGDKLAAMRRMTATNLARIATAIRAILEVVLFSGASAHVTSEMHIAAIRESYRDIMEKNRKLEEMNERMKEFDRLRSSFLATVSHELRTPLTSIIGYSDMLAEGIAGELLAEQKQFVETIKAKGDELLKLIGAILDFSQIDTGHITLQSTEVDPAELVRAAVGRKQHLADRRGVQLSVDLPADLPVVSLDPDIIGKALENLVENAVKFSLPGGVVRVSARIAPADSADGAEDGFGFVLMARPDMLEINVEDHGIGVPDADQERIFAPFTQADNSSTREHGGAGLGLAIVKHYVEAHGGRVHVRSHVNEGSAFSIRLPVVRD